MSERPQWITLQQLRWIYVFSDQSAEATSSLLELSLVTVQWGYRQLALAGIKREKDADGTLYG